MDARHVRTLQVSRSKVLPVFQYDSPVILQESLGYNTLEILAE